MDQAARVTSVESLRTFRTALLRMDADVQGALTQLGLELRRVAEWIEHDRSRYWPEQVKRASDRVAEARQDLERCEMRIGTEEPPSCYEQKKALERAKRRLKLAEDKVQAVRRWKIKLRHEIQELEGKLGQLSNLLETNSPQAAAALERMHAALLKYAEQREESGA